MSTNVNYSYKDTMAIFDELLQDLIYTDADDNSQKIKHSLSVVNSKGELINFNMHQLNNFIGVIIGNHQSINIQPSSHLITQYELNDLRDLSKDGYVIVNYQITVDNVNKLAIFEGILRNCETIETHQKYNPNAAFKDKVFSYTLQDFNEFSQFALSKCISKLHVNLEDMNNTIHADYKFSWDSGKINLEFIEND